LGELRQFRRLIRSREESRSEVIPSAAAFQAERGISRAAESELEGKTYQLKETIYGDTDQL
jgi:hypothetical protein